jgi:O-antigen/teichoic acid export membrane protein
MPADFGKLLKHTSIYGVFNILQKGVGFLLLPLYTRYLRPEHYGTLELIEITASVFEFFAGVGLTYAVFKFYHKYENKNERARVVSTALTSVILINIFFAIAGILFSDFFSVLIFKSTQYKTYLILIFFRIVVTGSIAIGIDYLRLINKPNLYGILSLSRLVSAVGLNILFLVFLEMGVQGILISSVISAFLVGLPTIIYLYSQFGFQFDLHKLIGMIKYGIPFVAVLIGQFIINSADRFILQRITSLEDVGIYALGYKFGFLVNFLVVVPFQLMWEGKMFEIEKQSDAKEVYSQVLTYFTLTLILIALSLTLFIDEILFVMTTPAYHSAARIVPFICLAYIFNGLQEYFRLGMLIKSRTSIVGTVMFLVGVLSPFLMILSTRYWGATGAAVAVAFLYFIIVAANYLFSQRLYLITIQNKRLFLIMTAAIVIVCFNYAIPSYDFLSALLIKMVLMLLFPIILVILGFMNPEEKSLLLSSFQRLKLKILWR